MSVSSATSLPMNVALHGVSGAGLRIDRVAGGERGRELRQVEHEREVPRRDRPTTPIGSRVDQAVGRHAEELVDGEVVLPLVAVDQVDVPLHVVDAGVQLHRVREHDRRPTSATICGRSSSLCWSSASLSCCRHACGTRGSSTSRSRRTPGGPRAIAAPCRGGRVGDLADDLFGRGVDVVERLAAGRVDELRRRSASGARTSSAIASLLFPCGPASSRRRYVAAACARAAVSLEPPRCGSRPSTSDRTPSTSSSPTCTPTAASSRSPARRRCCASATS